MKYSINLIIFLVLLLFCNTNAAYGQIRIGLATGVSMSPFDQTSINAVTPADSLRLMITNAVPPLHLGVYSRFAMKNAYIKGSILFARPKITYHVLNQADNRSLIETREEKSFLMEVPLTIGAKFDLLHFDIGFIGSYIVDPYQKSLLNIKTYRDAFSKLQWAIHSSIGYDLDARLSININYTYTQQQFHNITLFDNIPYHFEMPQHRLHVGINFSFVEDDDF